MRYKTRCLSMQDILSGQQNGTRWRDINFVPRASSLQKPAIRMESISDMPSALFTTVRRDIAQSPSETGAQSCEEERHIE